MVDLLLCFYASIILVFHVKFYINLPIFVLLYLYMLPILYSFNVIYLLGESLCYFLRTSFICIKQLLALQFCLHLFYGMMIFYYD